MGIPISQSRLLIRESKRRVLEGTVVQLGKQDVSFSEQQLREVASEEGFLLSEFARSSRSGQANPGNALSDVALFRMLGFAEVNSLDISNFEGANLLHDLNTQIPTGSPLESRFDLVYDGGTMEHVFHTPNVLFNCMALAKPGGRIIHSVPVDMVNHGFYNFSPTLFEDFYATNGYEINKVLVVKNPHYQLSNKLLCTDARRGSAFIRSLHAGLLDGATHNLFVLVTKPLKPMPFQVPMQGYYSKIFDSQSAVRDDGLAPENSALKQAYQRLLKIPVLKQIARYFRNRYAKSLISWEKI